MAIQPNEVYWTYEGPVRCFGRLIEKNWKGDTYAPTAGRALSNISQTYKTRHHLTRDYKIELDDKFLQMHDSRKGNYGRV